MVRSLMATGKRSLILVKEKMTEQVQVMRNPVFADPAFARGALLVNMRLYISQTTATMAWARTTS